QRSGKRPHRRALWFYNGIKSGQAVAFFNRGRAANRTGKRGASKKNPRAFFPMKVKEKRCAPGGETTGSIRMLFLPVRIAIGKSIPRYHAKNWELATNSSPKRTAAQRSIMRNESMHRSLHVA